MKRGYQMEQVKISIVTIVKNSFDKIEHTMQSVLQQTFSDFEYIKIGRAHV